MSFANELRAIRISTYKNQRNFAKAINVPYGTYPAWETGAALPHIERVKTVCATMRNKLGIKQEKIERLLKEYESDKRFQ